MIHLATASLEDELIRAISHENLAEIQRLLQMGANPNAPASNALTAIHTAGEHDVTGQIVSLLIDAGANINLQNLQGWTPLNFAVDMAIDGANQQNLPDIDWSTVKMMLNLGADPDIRDQHGKTVADLASSYGSKALQLFEKLMVECS